LIKLDIRAKTRLPQRAISKTRWQKLSEGLFGTTLAKLRTSIVAAVPAGLAVWAAYQNTIPDVAARDTEDASYVLPFVVMNKSVLFDMTDVAITCGFGSFFLQDQAGHTVSMVASLMSSQKDVRIAASQQVNFPCDVSGLIGYEVPMSVRGPRLNAPREPAKLTVTHITTRVTIKYTTAHLWHRSFASDTFVWDKDAKGFHWVRGNVIR
jgi:hypothetical protein